MDGCTHLEIAAKQKSVEAGRLSTAGQTETGSKPTSQDWAGIQLSAQQLSHCVRRRAQFSALGEGRLDLSPSGTDANEVSVPTIFVFMCVYGHKCGHQCLP